MKFARTLVASSSTLTSQAPTGLHGEPGGFIVDPSTRGFCLIELHSNEGNHKNAHRRLKCDQTRPLRRTSQQSLPRMGFSRRGSDDESKPLQIAETTNRIQKHNSAKVALAPLSLAQSLRSKSIVTLSERSKLWSKGSSKTHSPCLPTDPHRLN